MRIIFMGTPEFAVSSLEALIKSKLNVVAVVTSPDRPAGRGQQLQQSAVKQCAVAHNLPVLQPERLKDEHFIEALRSFKADLQIVVAFRMLPEAVWHMPPLGTYNLHASLLPKYRGAAPINWAIINGETETGVTTFKLRHEIDTGTVLFCERVGIQEDTTAGSLHDTLMKVGAELMLKTVKAIARSVEDKTRLNFIEQDDSQACPAPKLFKETCKISWGAGARSIYNLIRGLCPYPTAFTELIAESGPVQTVKIFYAQYEIKAHEAANGSLLTDNNTFLKVYCADGIVEIKELQLQGKKRMPVTDFLKGFKFNAAHRFT